MSMDYCIRANTKHEYEQGKGKKKLSTFELQGAASPPQNNNVSEERRWMVVFD